MKLCVIDTGGTFNKRYDEISGQLHVDPSGIAAAAVMRMDRIVGFSPC